MVNYVIIDGTKTIFDNKLEQCNLKKYIIETKAYTVNNAITISN